MEAFGYKSSIYQYNREMGDELASVGDEGGLIVVAKGVSSSAYQYG